MHNTGVVLIADFGLSVAGQGWLANLDSLTTGVDAVDCLAMCEALPACQSIHYNDAGSCWAKPYQVFVICLVRYSARL